MFVQLSLMTVLDRAQSGLETVLGSALLLDPDAGRALHSPWRPGANGQYEQQRNILVPTKCGIRSG